METPILFVQAGGSIDKGYPAGKDNHGYPLVIGEPAIHSIIQRLRPHFPWRVITACKKDSLDMDVDDRATVCRCALSAKENWVIVTHGTDTINLTADTIRTAVNSAVGYKDKVVVLTGSRLPEQFRDSDADSNVGMAIATVQLARPEVYIVLNGNVRRI